MTTIARPICTGCKHFDPTSWACPAFPDGIPLAILKSKADHRRPYDAGDLGPTFEPKTPADAAYAREVFGDLEGNET